MILLSVLVTACDPCHGWDEVELVDRKGLDDGDSLEALGWAMEAFAHWTGRETTCVGKIRLVDDLQTRGEDVDGRYNSVTNDIRVRQLPNCVRLEQTTLHELCHAADDEDGWPSQDAMDLLAPFGEGLDEAVYSTEEDRAREAFAVICEEGPQLDPLWRQLQERCGVEVDPAVAFVHEQLFAGRDLDLDLGVFESAVDTRVLEDLATEGLPVSGGTYSALMVAGEDGLYMLDMRLVRDDAEDFVAWQPFLRHLDSDAARETASVALPRLEETPRDPIGNPYPRSHELLGSSGAPILYDRYTPGTAWRVQGAPLTMETIAFPTLAEGTTVWGFEHEGRLLARLRTEEGDSIARASLGDASWAAVDFAALGLEVSHVFSFSADAQGAVAVVYGEAGRFAVGLSYDGALQWSWPLGSIQADGPTITRLPDGRVLLPAYLVLSDQILHDLPLLLEPASGALSAPDGDCSGARYLLQGVTWGDRTWMLWMPWDEEEQAFWLVELQIDDG